MCFRAIVVSLFERPNQSGIDLKVGLARKIFDLRLVTLSNETKKINTKKTRGMENKKTT